ncbi:hypothetical protein C8R48DRAFT_726834 [Suillus tomentosus]|nr:hypothetical protein C8R48DRAFT_726834 [Suillus tomentosus]
MLVIPGQTSPKKAASHNPPRSPYHLHSQTVLEILQSQVAPEETDPRYGLEKIVARWALPARI